MGHPRIVIVGGGFGGAYLAQSLERKLPRHSAEIVLLDRNNYFAFYPLLMEAGTGSLEPRHAVVSIRSFLKDTVFHMGEVESIDLDQRIVHYRLSASDRVGEVAYDHLVLASGSVTRWPDIPGLREYGYELKTLGDAVALRDRAIQLLEWADSVDDPAQRKALLHFVVVGGNFSGIEVAGELDAFIKKACHIYRHVSPSDCSVTLVEIADRILSILDEDLSDYATNHMRKRGISVRVKTTVAEVRRDSIILTGGEKLDTSVLIWCGGVEPNPQNKRLGLPLGPKGHILCERDLHVQGHKNVWSLGDCASIPDAQGKPYPPTAQHAVQEAYRLADNIVATLAGRSTTSCDIVSRGALAALGCRSGVAKVYGFKLSGFIAWFMWRSVYLMKMPGLACKVKVALDWTLDILFPHEHVQLGVHRHHRPSGRE